MGKGRFGLGAVWLGLAAAQAGADPAGELMAILSRPQAALEVRIEGAALTDRDLAAYGGGVADEKRLWLCDFRIVAAEDHIDLVLRRDLNAAHHEAHDALGRAVVAVEPREPAAIWFLLKPRAARSLLWSGYRDLWEAAQGGEYGPVAARNWQVTYDVEGDLSFYAPLFEHWFDLEGPEQTARVAELLEAVIARECG